MGSDRSLNVGREHSGAKNRFLIYQKHPVVAISSGVIYDLVPPESADDEEVASLTPQHCLVELVPAQAYFVPPASIKSSYIFLLSFNLFSSPPK